MNDESISHSRDDHPGGHSGEEILQQICREPVKEAIVRASLTLRTNWSGLTHLLTEGAGKSDSQHHTGNATRGIPDGSFPSAISPQATVSQTTLARWGNESRATTPANVLLRWLRWSSLVLLTVACGGYAGYRLAHANSFWIDTDGNLDLSVHYKADQLAVRWNPNANAMATASSGSMSIQDGKRAQTVHLTLEQLLSGKLLYSPSSDDVSLRLDVLDAKGVRTGSESVRAVGLVPHLRHTSPGNTSGGMSKSPAEEKPLAVESPDSKAQPLWSVFPPQALKAAPE